MLKRKGGTSATDWKSFSIKRLSIYSLLSILLAIETLQAVRLLVVDMLRFPPARTFRIVCITLMIIRLPMYRISPRKIRKHTICLSNAPLNHPIKPSVLSLLTLLTVHLPSFDLPRTLLRPLLLHPGRISEHIHTYIPHSSPRGFLLPKSKVGAHRQ